MNYNNNINITATEQKENKVTTVVTNPNTESIHNEWDNVIDPTKVQLPKLPRSLWSLLKEINPEYRWPCFFSLISGLAPYTSMRVKYRKSENPIVFHCYIIGNSASGKGAIFQLNKLARNLMMKQDRERLATYAAWEKLSASAKKNIPEPPHFKQFLGDRTTQVCAIQEVSLAPEVTRFVGGSEIDTLFNQAGNRYGLQTDFLRKAFDGDEVSTSAAHPDSPKVYPTPARVCVCFAGTREKMRRFFCDVTDGSLNRGIFPIMPYNPYDIDGLVLPEYSEGQLKTLEAVCEKLQNMDCSKTYEFAPIEEAIRKWLESKKELCQQHNRPHECQLTHRPAVNGFRIGCLLAAIRGEYSKDLFSMRDCCQTAVTCAEYIWRSMLYNWGEDINRAAEKEIIHGDAKNINQAVFAMLPQVFKRADVIDERKKKGEETSENNLKKILQRWTSNGWIESQRDGSYRKL